MGPIIVARIFPESQKALASASEKIVYAVIEDLLSKLEAVTVATQERLLAQFSQSSEEKLRGMMDQPELIDDVAGVQQSNINPSLGLRFVVED